jgi:glycosyltransferase involved in cell wall biosynthesis
MVEALPAEQIAPEISVVVPLYNEEDNVAALAIRLREALRSTARSYEIIFVDDGSADRTLELARQAQTGESDLRIVQLQGNFGQTAALAAGFDHARGEIVIAMDGDLQDDPAEIPRFLEKMNEGYDVVSGWRQERSENVVLRLLPSRAANWMMRVLSGLPVRDFGGTFKAYRANLLRSMIVYGQLHRFMPVLAHEAGAKMCEIPIAFPARAKGKSKYGFGRRTLTVFFDLIRLKFLISFFARPLQVFGVIGLATLLCGGVIFAWLIYERLFHGLSLTTTHGPLFIVSIFAMLAGLQIFTFGLLGEMIVRLFYSHRNNKIYRVRRVWETPPKPR